EPDPERVKKATRLAKSVKVFSFNTKSNVWWEQNRGKFGYLNAQIVRLSNEGIEQMAEMTERTMDLSVMLTGNSAFVNSDTKSAEVTWEELQSNE
ncbi:YaeQ family protein, partial [Vibrio sp. D173a]